LSSGEGVLDSPKLKHPFLCAENRLREVQFLDFFCFSRKHQMNHAQQTRLLLEIYVSQHCWNCEEALLIAEQARHIPGITVQVIDLDQKGNEPPPRILAVPTYVLNGKIVSLGNPAREEFLSQLSQEESQDP
jgi:hypothetical protein